MKLARSTLGAGMLACIVHSVPCVCRHAEQWQKCTGMGRAEMGTVKDSEELRQWQDAVKERVGGSIVREASGFVLYVESSREMFECLFVRAL